MIYWQTVWTVVRYGVARQHGPRFAELSLGLLALRLTVAVLCEQSPANRERIFARCKQIAGKLLPLCMYTTLILLLLAVLAEG